MITAEAMSKTGVLDARRLNIARDAHAGLVGLGKVTLHIIANPNGLGGLSFGQNVGVHGHVGNGLSGQQGWHQVGIGLLK